MTVLLSVIANELPMPKRELGDERLFSRESEEIERRYQEQVLTLLGRLLMATPWMIREGE